MYNEKIKKKFIDSANTKSIRNRYVTFINKIAKNIEVPLGKDIAEMSTSEIVKGFEKMDYITSSTLRSDITILNNYLYWYNKNIADVDPKTISAEDIDISESIKNLLFSGEDDLKASLSYWPSDMGYCEAPISFLTWLGLELDEILNLKNEDVFFKNNEAYIQVRNSVFKIESEYIANLLEEYSKVKVSTREHRGTWVVYPSDLGYFIKNFVARNSRFAEKRLTPADIRKRFSVCNTKIENKHKFLSVYNIFLSGQLWRIREKERNGVNISDSDFIEEFGKLDSQKLLDKKRLYEDYKKVFGN